MPPRGASPVVVVVMFLLAVLVALIMVITLIVIMVMWPAPSWAADVTTNDKKQEPYEHGVGQQLFHVRASVL